MGNYHVRFLEGWAVRKAARLLDPTHTFWLFVIRYHVGILRELLVANRTYSVLLDNLPIQELSHFCRRAQFPIAARMVWVIHTFYTQSQITRPGQRLASAAKQRSMNGTAFVTAKSHTTFPP